jgi:dihydropteroate synthase
MGILNITPDSFAEARALTPGDAVEMALRMEGDGADLIDIGGESTRPGAEPVGSDEEAARVLPVIEALHGRLRVPISIDTYKSSVADRALASGAGIVNDVSGLLRCGDGWRGRLARRRRRSDAHPRPPEDDDNEALYTDLVSEVTLELRDRMARATAAGVLTERILVDPGLGFAKQPEHSYGVLARLPEIAAALDRPILVGPSRKSFLREAAGGRAAPDRDWATAAAVTSAVLSGAHIIRVHAVAEMVQVVRAAEAIRGARG